MREGSGGLVLSQILRLWGGSRGEPGPRYEGASSANPVDSLGTSGRFPKPLKYLARTRKGGDRNNLPVRVECAARRETCRSRASRNYPQAFPLKSTNPPCTLPARDVGGTSQQPELRR